MFRIAILFLICFSEVSLANYRTAQAYLQRRNYMAAAPEFFKAYNYPSNRAERANAEYGLARSLEGVGLNYSASYYYSIIARKGPRHPFFRQALEALGRIDSKASLGRAHVGQLFQKDINPAMIPGNARGFYFYYKGLEAFSNNRRNKASEHFSRVNSSSKYYSKAKFHLGVIANLEGRTSRAIQLFESSKNGGSKALKTQANLNIARAYYEKGKYRQAFRYYAMVDRKSDHWLDTVFESSWAFFILKKHNNTLGNIHTIHSPFFEDRFFPEAYILQSITFLRLCRFGEVKKSLKEFQSKYKPVSAALNRMLGEFRGRPGAFYKVVSEYKDGSLSRYERVWSIIDALSRTDIFAEAKKTNRRSDRELQKLGNAPNKWQQVGLYEELDGFLKKKKSAAISTGGRNLLAKARTYKEYLQKLSSQTQFIQLEMNMGKINNLRKKLNVKAAEDKKVNFIGGLQELKVGQDLEYWPFQGEYWEDELGGYVYNVDSKCGSGGRSKKK